MEYMEIRLAYNDVKYGKKSLDDVLAMYQEMPDKKAAFQNGETLLHLAAANLHLEAVVYLLGEGCDPNAPDELACTPLWSVAMRRELTPDLAKNTVYDITTALLKAGGSPMKKNSDGAWCYLAAAKEGNGEFIAALHDKGARITRTDDRGNNALHLLIESLYNPINDHRLYAEKLKKHEADGAHESTLENDRRLENQSREKMECRLAMAFRGVNALLDAGVDPEDKNNMGETAHVLAERRGAKKIGALLRGEIAGEENALGGDEDAALREKAGGMNLHQAVGKKDEQAVRALVQLGSDLNEIGDIYGYGEGTPLAMAMWNCDLSMVELLLELGADPNFRAGDGTTAIAWLSASHNNRDMQKIFQGNWPAKIIAAMVKNGMDIDDIVDDHSNTLLTWALRDNHDMEMFLMRETLRWLVVNAAIVHGADVNKSNLAGQTSLMLASGANPARDMQMGDEIQYLLLENGADVAAKDKNGNTPLIYAAQNSGQAAKEMAENLFDFGDQLVDHVNNAGKSALDYATEANNEMLVKLLLNNI